jgi:hypothetical protein
VERQKQLRVIALKAEEDAINDEERETEEGVARMMEELAKKKCCVERKTTQRVI